MFYRGHRRTNSNTSNISSISRVSYSSDHYYSLGVDRSTTPTNFLPQVPSATASQRSIAGSPAVSHEEDLREIIVLAENAKNETLTCPLCGGVFRDPYIAACGVSYYVGETKFREPYITACGVSYYVGGTKFREPYITACGVSYCINLVAPISLCMGVSYCVCVWGGGLDPLYHCMWQLLCRENFII